MATFRSGVSSPLFAARRLGDFRVGETGELTRRFGPEQMAVFAELIGDNNPIHFDEEYAATTRFGRCIVHGTLYSGLIGTVLGTVCPGPGTILIAQEHRFHHPVYVGDDVSANVEITEVDEKNGSIRLGLSCRNQEGITVLSGWALTRIAR